MTPTERSAGATSLAAGRRDLRLPESAFVVSFANCDNPVTTNEYVDLGERGRVGHEEGVVLVELELGALTGLGYVFDRHRVQGELIHQGLQFVGRGIDDIDPARRVTAEQFV